MPPYGWEGGKLRHTFRTGAVFGCSHCWPASHVIFEEPPTNVSSTSTKDFDEENPCIERGRDESQHGAGKDPVQPAP